MTTHLRNYENDFALELWAYLRPHDSFYWSVNKVLGMGMGMHSLCDAGPSSFPSPPGAFARSLPAHILYGACTAAALVGGDLLTPKVTPAQVELCSSPDPIADGELRWLQALKQAQEVDPDHVVAHTDRPMTFAQLAAGLDKISKPSGDKHIPLKHKRNTDAQHLF